jgi:hypothetical protein
MNSGYQISDGEKSELHPSAEAGSRSIYNKTLDNEKETEVRN